MLKMIIKKVRKATLGDKISWVIGLLSLVFILWIAFSFIEVQIHNFTMISDNPYEYSEMNFFAKMLEWF